MYEVISTLYICCMESQNKPHLIPIYLTNIHLELWDTVDSKKKTYSAPKLKTKLFLKSVVVKGFSVEDIKKRDCQKIFKKAQLEEKLNTGSYFKIINIELISQHGWGIVEN